MSTPKIDDHARIEFLSQFRLKIEPDLTHFWILLPDGKYCKAKSLRKVIDEAMRFTKKLPKQGE